MTSALVIGYGNPLRGDDGAGPRVAELMADRSAAYGATVLIRPQLLPELAADLVGRSVVVFVDAVADFAAGSVAYREVTAGDGVGEAAGMTHQCSPETLLVLAERLYGAKPKAFLVTLGAASFDLGEPLSPTVEAALPEAVATVIRLVEG